MINMQGREGRHTTKRNNKRITLEQLSTLFLAVVFSTIGVPGLSRYSAHLRGDTGTVGVM